MKKKTLGFLIFLFGTIQFVSAQTHSTYHAYSLQSERGNNYNYYVNSNPLNLFGDAGYSKSFGKNNRLKFDYSAQLNFYHTRNYPFYFLDYYSLPYPDFQSYSEINLNIPLAITYYYLSPNKHKFSFGTSVELGLSNTILNITRTHYYDFPGPGNFSSIINFMYNDGHFGTTPGINAFVGMPFRINFDNKEYVELTTKVNLASNGPRFLYSPYYMAQPSFATQITYGFQHQKSQKLNKTITPSF